MLHLKKWRLARGMTQADLAGKLGVPTSTICKWERGSQPLRLQELAALATALQVSVYDLWVVESPRVSAEGGGACLRS